MPVSYYVFIVYFVLSPHYKSLCMVIPANFFSTLTIHFCKILWKLHMVRTTNSSQFLFHNFSQVRTFRGHSNEKNFVGLTVNSEYIACGSETNEVFAYHKVTKYFKKLALGIQSQTNLIFVFTCRPSPNLQLGTGLVHLIWMILMMTMDHISSVLCVGRAIAQQC